MAAALSFTSAFSHYTDGKPVSSTLRNTAETVSFLDDLFDSVNGSTLSHIGCKGKQLRKAVTSSSLHHQFWRDAKRKIEILNILDKEKKKSVPTLKNWVTTIKSFERVWQVLKTYNVKVMRPRYFNSDPIENFFGRVRAYNFRNNDPTCHTFIYTFKSLMITGLIKFHSESFNCEDDACDQLIKVKELFKKCEEEKVDINVNQETSRVHQHAENIQLQAARERLNTHSRAYTRGWIIKKLKTKIICAECEINLCTDVESSVHKWISHKEFKTMKTKKLIYPSEISVRCFGSIINETNECQNCVFLTGQAF